jgi:hypothetical protein
MIERKITATIKAAYDKSVTFRLAALEASPCDKRLGYLKASLIIVKLTTKD